MIHFSPVTVANGPRFGQKAFDRPSVGKVALPMFGAGPATEGYQQTIRAKRRKRNLFLTLLTSLGLVGGGHLAGVDMTPDFSKFTSKTEQTEKVPGKQIPGRDNNTDVQPYTPASPCSPKKGTQKKAPPPQTTCPLQRSSAGNYQGTVPYGERVEDAVRRLEQQMRNRADALERSRQGY
jgi:hypothetical protein